MKETISRKRAAGWVIATVLAPLAIYTVISCTYISFWYVRTGHQGRPPPEVIVESIKVGAPLCLWATVGLWWLIHRRGTSFAELFNTRTAGLGADVALGLCLGAVWVAIYGLFDVVAFGDMFVLGSAKLASVPASASAGFCEEFLFRGFLFLVIARAGGGTKSKLAVTSLAFGLSHVFWGPWGMVWTTLLGLTFGLVTHWRRSVWPAVIAHALLNLCIEPGLIEKAVTGGFGS